MAIKYMCRFVVLRSFKTENGKENDVRLRIFILNLSKIDTHACKLSRSDPLGETNYCQKIAII